MKSTYITNRKRVERELTATKDYLKTVFNKIHDAIFVHDLTGKVIDVNEKMLELYRISREDAIGLSIVPDYSAPDNPALLAHQPVLWGRVMAGEDQFFEWRARRPDDGSIFDVEVALTKLSLPEGNFILAGVRDITNRKRVERELTATKDYLKTVFNKIHDAIFVHDLTGKVIDVNEKMLELYRISREDAIGLSIVPDYSAPDNPALLAHQPVLWGRVMAGEDQFFEWRARRPDDGSIFDVEVALTKLSLPEGNFVLAGVRDITDRKYIERELTATKDYLKTVFNNIHDAIYVHDNTGKIIDVNNKMLELHKCTREEAVSHYIHDFSTPDNPLNEMPHLWNTVLEGKNHFFEWKCRRPKDGSTIDVEIYLTRLSLPEGNLVLANVRDITERKRIEKLLVKEREIFFSVMENNPHGIALADDDGKFIYLNPEFTNISGYTLEDVPTAREWARKAYPDAEFRKKVVEVWKADRVPKGRGKDMEFAVTCRNGQQKDVEFRQTYLGDRSLVVLTDTTARNRAEKDLRAEKQKFQTLSESSPVGMVMIGETGGFEFRYVNPKFKDIFGYRAFDTPGINEWFARIYPEPASRLRSIAKWIDVVKAIKPRTGRSYIRKLNGNGGGQKHIKFILVRLETGEILMTCWDITRNKEAEEKIRERNLVLEVLNDVMGSVGSSIHLQEILAALQGVFTKKLKIPAGAIFLYNEVSSKNNMEAWWGVPESARDDVEAFALECYRNGKIIHEDDATLVRNEVCNLDPKIVAPFKRHKWTSYLCAPLSAKGDVQGMIFLVDKKHDGFNDDGVALYKTLGQQIGVATQNARLFEQVRLSHAQMKALSLRLVEVQEAERRYIARELHDEIGQELTGLKLALEMAARQREGTIPSGLRQAQSLANKLVELVRELSLNLRPAILDDLGLLLTLPWHFTRFTNQTGIRVNFEHTGLGNRRLPIQMETAVYRIIQEALTNVARHAKTGEVTVRLWADNGVVGTQIEDPGIGFDTALVLNNCSTNGIGGMRERAMLLGGHFTVESQPGAGTRLTAELPTGGHHGPNQDSPGR